MKCENIRELMSAYIDEEVNEVDKAKFEKHIAQCPQCKEEYQLLKDMVLECSEIDEVELPESFREELHSKLMEAKAAKPSRFAKIVRNNKWKTGIGAVAAVLIIAISLNSLGAPGGLYKEEAAMDRSGEMANNTAGNDMAKSKGFGAASTPEAAPAPASMAPQAPMADSAQAELKFSENVAQNYNLMTTTTTSAPQETRKIIKNGNVSLKVADIQGRIQEITKLAEQSGGYVESSYVDNIVQPYVETTQDVKAAKEATTMISNMTIKIPAERFESSFQSIIAMGKLVNQSSNSNDITVQYRDLEARVANLKIQEKNLQEIMTKATTVEDTLKVETELNRVRTEIDIMTGNLKNWDLLVEYSTIYVNMTEVKEAELETVDVPGVWQNAQQGFIRTINNIQNGMEILFVFLISALPYVVIVGAGSLLAFYWIKKRKK